MKRTVSELRQAVIDAGWEGDPLATEIMAALTDAAAPALAPARTDDRSRMWLTLASAIGSAAVVGLVVLYFWSTSAIKARDEELARIRTEAVAQQVRSDSEIARRDVELTRLKTESATQLSSAATQMQALITAAEAVTKNSAAAADSNHRSVNLYMTEFQKLLEEAKRLQGLPAAAPGTNK